eukprot:s233_g27.t3
MVAEGNLYERICTLRADQKLWMSEMRDGNTGLSAKATEFVPGCGGAFQGLSSKATEYVPVSDFKPEGASQPWGWSGGRWNGEMASNGIAWGGTRQDWGYYNGYGDPNLAWQGQGQGVGGVGAQGCVFNEDAYSTDSSESSSEPEEEDDVDEPKPSQGAPDHGVSEVPGGTSALQSLTSTAPVEEIHDQDSDSDEFNSFSEDEPELDIGKDDATHQTTRGGTQSSVQQSQVNGADQTRKYDLDLMLAVRRAVGAESSSNGTSELPRWSTQADLEKPPDWLLRRSAESETREESNGKDWRSRSKSQSRRSGQEKPQKGLEKPEAPVRAPPPKLEVSETSWAAQVAKRKAELNKESSDDVFVKGIRSTLNKLTVEKFDTLSDQIIDLIAQSNRPNHGIPLLMQLVFEKATTQHHFINMYVSLCVKLHKWLTDNMDVAESQSNFKRVLLNQCQTSFEQYLEPPEGFDGLTGDELYEAQVKYKTKMLGNIRLVGQLIRHGDDPAVRGERLETLATFLETVGVALDDPSWKHHGELETVFTEVERASADKSVPRRVRCLLQDVLDLRKEGWKSQRRKDLSKETPQTLAEVHEKAKADQAPSKKEITRSVSQSKLEAEQGGALFWAFYECHAAWICHTDRIGTAGLSAADPSMKLGDGSPRSSTSHGVNAKF